MKKNKQDDLEKELIESGNKTRIDAIVSEIRELYKSERNARAQRTNLLLGQKFLELRKLVTGTDDDFNPKSAEGRRWGRFVKSYLRGCGVSRATTYRCAQAWKAASAMVPEPVLTQLAEREEMIGVAVSGEKPLGKFTLAMEAATEDEPNFEDQDDAEAFIENVLASPEQPKKSDRMHSLYIGVIRGLAAIAKGRQTKATLGGEKRELTAEMLCEPLYTLVSAVQRGIEMQGTHDYETANELPEGYGDWREVIAKQTEPTEVREIEQAKPVPKPKIGRAAKARTQAKAQKSAAATEQTAELPGVAVGGEFSEVRNFAVSKENDQSLDVRENLAPAGKSRRALIATTVEQRKAKPTADAHERNEDVTETTQHGYFAKLNHKPKNATETAQPWEVFRGIDGAKPKFCCRERSWQDAEARCSMLDRIAEEEKQDTPTATDSEPEQAAAI